MNIDPVNLEVYPFLVKYFEGTGKEAETIRIKRSVI